MAFKHKTSATDGMLDCSRGPRSSSRDSKADPERAQLRAQSEKSASAQIAQALATRQRSERAGCAELSVLDKSGILGFAMVGEEEKRGTWFKLVRACHVLACSQEWFAWKDRPGFSI